VAYDNNIPACYWTWDIMMKRFEDLNAQVGYLIPLVLAVGNHDVGLEGLPRRALNIDSDGPSPLFLTLFPQ